MLGVAIVGVLVLSASLKLRFTALTPPGLAFGRSNVPWPMVCETHLCFLESSTSWRCYVRNEDWAHCLSRYYEGRVVHQSGTWRLEFSDRALTFGSIDNTHSDGSFVVAARDTGEAFRIRMERDDLREFAKKVAGQLHNGAPRAAVFLNETPSVPSVWHVTIAHSHVFCGSGFAYFRNGRG